jgi:hypothetical protein
MRFQMPQFIEVEDKIFGPFTFQQFIYLAGAAGVTAALYLTVGLFWAILVGGPFVALGMALAFLKINERPFIQILEAWATYLTTAKLYIWDKKSSTPDQAPVATPTENSDEDLARYVPTISQSKIKDLAWSLDIKESIYSDKSQR